MNIRKLLAMLMLLAATTLPLAAQNKAQKYNIAFSSEPLKTVFERLEQTSGYKILYAYDDISAYKVTAEYKKKTFFEILDDVISGKPLDYTVKGRFVTIKKADANAKNRFATLEGHVVDENGEPLPGVYAKVKDDANLGAITDADGKFYMRLTRGKATDIDFTYIGKETVHYTYGGKHDQHDLVIEMRDAAEYLNECIVTGYQDIQKSKMTGSAITINAAKLDERYTPNIMDNLEGRVAGLSTYGGKMTIRGTSSLYAEASPLLVVDGLPIEGDIEDINPYDIETVNVLKDAAATAIYGARASNGIIVITTKNAKEKGKINIDFTSNLTVYEKKNMDYADNFYMTPEQQVNVESDYWEYYYFNNEGEIYDPISTTASYMSYGLSISPLQYAYYQLATGAITRDQLNSKIAAFKKNNYAKEYGENVLRRQVLQQYNLALRSRSDKSAQNLTLNYKYDNTGYVNAYDKQVNINYKGIFDITKWLTSTFTVNGVIGRTKETGSDYLLSGLGTAWSAPAYISLYDDDGNYAWTNGGFGTPYSPFEQNSAFRTMRYNPLEDLYEDTVNKNSLNLRVHADLLFKIIDGLTFNTQFVYETIYNNSRECATANSFKYRQMRNGYTTFDSNGNYKYLVPENGGMLLSSNTRGNYMTWRGQINYGKTFGKHAISAIAGLEFRETKYKGENGLMLGYDDMLQTNSNTSVDFSTISTIYNSPVFNNGYYYPQQYAYNPYIKNSMMPVTEERHRYASGYFNATYTYDERYNVFASFRKDYADVYGLNVKFRGKPLWSVGTAWNINNEAFMKSAKWIDVLKLRFSYGVTGNIYQGATSYMTAAISGNNSYTLQTMAEVESPANPELKWEQTRTTNVGIDFSLLENRLRGSLDWYHKVGKDLFSYKNLAPSSGFTTMFVNMASMKNDGVELQLTYDWYRSANQKGFNWTTTYTASYNKNKITDVENSSTLAYELINNPYVVGYPQSALWSYVFAGIDNETNKGETLWYDSDGNVNHNVQSTDASALIYSGQSEPKVIMGLDNTLRYGGFSLSILLAYYGGHVIRALAEMETASGSMPISAISSYFLNAWTPNNPTNTPGIGRYGSTSIGWEPTYADIAVRPTDFVKIRNIVLGYEVPKEFVRKLHLERVALRFQIDNPKYLWVKNSVHVDPETLGVRNPSAYIFGLNINI